MVVDESAWHVMHERLDDVLGREVAGTLMAHLPPVGWQDVARRSDVDHLATVTRGDIDHLAAVTKHDLDHLAVTVKLTIQASADSLRAEFYKSQTAQTRTLVSWMIGAIVTVAGLAFGAAQLG